MSERFQSAPFFLLCILLAATLTGTRAEVYKWVDADGRVQLSDRPPSTGGAERVQVPEINTYRGVRIEQQPGLRTDAPRPGKAKKVVMYSASWCGMCARARQFFKAEDIPFRELDIERNRVAQRDWERMNATGVPVILVGGKRMDGFSEAQFLQLYQN